MEYQKKLMNQGISEKGLVTIVKATGKKFTFRAILCKLKTDNWNK